MTNILKPTSLSATEKKASKKPIKKKSKRRKGRFHTGIYNSLKCKKPIGYRSGWELVVCESLDLDPNVIEYFYEDLIIPYKTKPTQIKNKRYIIDFFVIYADGTKKIIEVKADHKVNHYLTLHKTAAAKKWCQQHNVEYEIWSSQKIKELVKEQKEIQKTNKDFQSL